MGVSICVIDCGCIHVQALHEALMRQEELLAYIDSEEEAKFRVCIQRSIINAMQSD